MSYQLGHDLEFAWGAVKNVEVRMEWATVKPDIDHEHYSRSLLQPVEDWCDLFGNPIKHGGNYRIAFADEVTDDETPRTLADVKVVESYKRYN